MPVSRRRALASASAAVASLSSLVALAAQAATPSLARRMPVLFIGHGSPMNAVSDNGFTRRLQAWGTELPRPAAILVVSAHWLTRDVTAVGVQEKPPTIHDFGGFPRELHEMQYPAPGHPPFAREAASLVKQGPTQHADDWGLDHGTWTVLHHLYPKADLPVFQVSIDYFKPGAFHYAVGRELQPLRDKGVLIVGSGSVVHNLRATKRGTPDAPRAGAPWAQAFDDAVKKSLDQRDDKALLEYLAFGDAARMAVPTPDHYWPMLYALGAADGKPPRHVFEGFQSGTLSMRCLQFG